MSHRPCEQTGEDLPADVTCCAGCVDFPACRPLLSPPSENLIGTVAKVLITDSLLRLRGEALSDTLQQIHDAITMGLNKKDKGKAKD